LTVFEKVPNAVGPPSTPRKLWIGAPHHLGGIVVNNAILLVDQAGRQIREGMSIQEALIEAGHRAPPVPDPDDHPHDHPGPAPAGPGHRRGFRDAQAPLARAVVGGLTGSTLITLVLIPMVFASFHPDPSALQVVRLSPAASQTRGG